MNLLKKNYLSLIICFFILVTSNSKLRAQSLEEFFNPNWPQDSILLLQNFPEVLRDSFLFTLWGECHAPTVSVKDLSAQRIELKYSSRDLTQGKLTYALYRQDNEKKPLVVLIPGVFSNLDEPRSLRIVKTLLQKTHVLLLPNPLGTEYLLNAPSYNMGEVESEASILYGAIAQAVYEAKKRGIQIQNVNLMGISYGAFISSVIAAKDFNLGQHIIDGQVILLSPPYKLMQSMQALDSLLDTYDQYFDYFPQIRYAPELAKFCLAPQIPSWRKKDLELARYLTGHLGFHDSLVDSINTYEELNGQESWFQKLGMVSMVYRMWYKEQRFVKYLKEHFPQTLNKLLGPKGNILYWLNQVSQKKDAVKVLTCKDDFINPNNEWNQDPRVSSIEHCGHFGMQGLSWLDNFLLTLF